MMNITIIGSGNVAAAFAQAIHNSDSLHLLEVCARNRKRGKALADLCCADFTTTPEEMKPADLYIISVSDSAIGSIAERIPNPEHATVAHTCGGLSIDILGNIRNKAVIYPLQTFSQGRSISLCDVPLFIEFTTPQARKVVRMAAEALSVNVIEAGSDLRNKLHIAAVFACNFTNHMYTLAARFAESEGLKYDLLKPLIEETAAKALSTDDPASAQTGPASRGDKITIQRHEQILTSEERNDYLEIYKLLSNNIWETLKKI